MKGVFTFHAITHATKWLAAAALLAGCSPPLTQPAVHAGDPAPRGAYYVVPDSLPRLDKKKDCKTLAAAYDARKDGDPLLLAICDVNLGRIAEGRDHAALGDSCRRRLVEYDLRLKEGLSKRFRFDLLEDLISCTPDPDFKRSVRVRGKLAHYEDDR